MTDTHTVPPEELTKEELVKDEPLKEDAHDSTEPTVTDYHVAKKLVQLKQSADSRKLEFNLTFKTVKRLMKARKCFYTGKIFSSGVHARSVDRVDSSLGYIEGNVVACTVEINQVKSNIPTKDLILLGKKVLEHQRRKKK